MDTARPSGVMLCFGKALLIHHQRVRTQIVCPQFAVAGILPESLDSVRKRSGVLAGFLPLVFYTEERKAAVGC